MRGTFGSPIPTEALVGGASEYLRGRISDAGLLVTATGTAGPGGKGPTELLNPDLSPAPVGCAMDAVATWAVSPRKGRAVFLCAGGESEPGVPGPAITVSVTTALR
jgi:hypothetical protein